MMHVMVYYPDPPPTFSPMNFNAVQHGVNKVNVSWTPPVSAPPDSHYFGSSRLDSSLACETTLRLLGG